MVGTLVFLADKGPVSLYQDPHGVAVGLLVLRVVAGITMALHGYAKFFRGGKLAGTARWFDSMGMRPGKIHALAAASTEVGGGLMLAAGLLTPLAGAAFVGLMIVAGWTSHRKNGFFIVKTGWEYNLSLAVVGVAMGLTGPGQYSLDRVIGFHVSPCVGLVLSAGVGVVAGIGTLAVFYRPPKQ